MSKTVLFKGGDARIYVNGKILCRVLSVKISESCKTYDIYEYLSGEAVKRLPLKREYIITVERAFSPEDGTEEYEDFTLTVKTGDRKTAYTGCNISEKTVEIKPDGTPAVVVKINAVSKKEVNGNES